MDIVQSNLEKRDEMIEKYKANHNKTSLRKVHLVLDYSKNMLDRDFLPNTIYMVLTKAIEYVQEFFELNPLSNLAISTMRDRKCNLVVNFKNNPTDLVAALENLRKKNNLGEENLFEEFNKDPDADASLDIPLGMPRLSRRDLDRELPEGDLGVDGRPATLLHEGSADDSRVFEHSRRLRHI
jgi:hypothetical protein